MNILRYWRWMGCLLCWGLAPLAAVHGQQDAWGNLTGRIQVRGTVPPPAKKVVDKDQAICMKEGELLDENLLVDSEGFLRDVFVMMVLKADEKVPVHPSCAERVEKSVVLDNVNCRFVPHALFVQTGQKLTLKNSDDVGHNCHIITFGNEENVNLPAGGSVDVTLKISDKTPGGVVCDIHKWMDAVILVRDEPYAAISDKNGKFSIENLPAGTWKFQFWHKKSGYLSKLEIPGREVSRRGEVELTIAPGETLDLGTLIIPVEALDK